MEFRFEWDEDKDILNQMKHGVSFELAKVVFFDLMRFDMYDWEHRLFEERWNTVGLCNYNVLSVTYTLRKGIIRIISARKASKKEEEEYFYGYGTDNIYWR